MKNLHIPKVAAYIFVCMLSLSLLSYAMNASAASDFTVESDKTDLDMGDTMSIKVELSGGGNFNSAQVTLDYSVDEFEYIETKTGDIYNKAFLNTVFENEGCISLVVSYTENISEGGILGEFSFKAVGNKPADAVIDITIKASDMDLRDYKQIEQAEFKLNGGAMIVATEAPATKSPSKPSSGGGGSHRPSVTAVPSSTAVPASAATTAPIVVPTQVAEPTAFTDIANHWAKSEIDYLSARRLINGFSDNTFRPDENVTRAQFVKMLLGAKDIADAEYSVVFKDVSKSDWFAPSVIAANKAGIVYGGDDGYFNPNAYITRQEMTVMAARAFDLMPGAGCAYEDKQDIAEWAVPSVSAAYDAGVIKGMDGNLFMPNANTTRAQAAAVIARLCRD